MVREKGGGGGGAGEGGSHSEWKFSMNFYNAKPDNRRRNDTRFKAHLLYKIIFDIAASKRKYTKRFSTDLENSSILRSDPALFRINQLEISPWIFEYFTYTRNLVFEREFINRLIQLPAFLWSNIGITFPSRRNITEIE